MKDKLSDMNYYDSDFEDALKDDYIRKVLS